MVNWLKCFWFLQQMIDLTIRRFDTMRTIFAEYNPKHNSIDVYTSVGYMLRIDCWEAEKDLKTTPGSDCALNETHSPLMNLLNMQDYILMEICRCG